MPPETELVSVMDEPTHTGTDPMIGPGTAPTVNNMVATPAGPVNVMTDVPAATPETMPLVKPTVATEGVLLVQVPVAPAESVSVVVLPTHVPGVPNMVA